MTWTDATTHPDVTRNGSSNPSTVWAAESVIDTIAWTWLWLNPSQTVRYSTWYWITISSSKRIVSVDKRPGTTATYCYIYSWYEQSPFGTLIASAPFVGDVATFNEDLDPWNYLVVCDRQWSSFAAEYGSKTPAYPQIWTNLTFVNAWVFSGSANTTQILWISSITTQSLSS